MFVINLLFHIADAAKKGGVKEAESEHKVRDWLRYAKDRDGGRRRRAEKKRRE